MKLSISNIAWPESDDNYAFELMHKLDFTGLEIAPTRIFPQTPYDHLNDVTLWSNNLKAKFGFVIPSLQSIWYGKSENIFLSQEHREILQKYTEKTIDFASACGASNLVFGCPKNRNIPDGVDPKSVIPFFKTIANYALKHNCVIALEANPTIYNTNFLNTTRAAIDFARQCNHSAIKLNLDLGTMIYNQESLQCLDDAADLIHHVHISEPWLNPIETRSIHSVLAKKLNDMNYQGFVSIEMKKLNDINDLESIMSYIRSIFT